MFLLLGARDQRHPGRIDGRQARRKGAWHAATGWANPAVNPIAMGSPRGRRRRLLVLDLIDRKAIECGESLRVGSAWDRFCKLALAITLLLNNLVVRGQLLFRVGTSRGGRGGGRRGSGL